jgi:LEA14-like dessication related protein
MKNILPYGLVAVLAFLGFKYAKKGFAAKVLNTKIRSIRLNPISKAALIVEIINPSSTDVAFNSITLDLLLDGFALSTLNYQKPTRVGGNSSVQINIPFKINPLDGVQFIANLLTNKSKPKTVSVTGSINGEGFVIPVDLKQTLNA